MRLFASREHHRVNSTARMEAYSDAFLAIIITLLVLELDIPELHDSSVRGMLSALSMNLPHLGAFAFSFLTIAVFWVNHHHFFHEVERIDARVLWLNNGLLFWLALVPFTTAFLGEHPFTPSVVMLYSFVLFMAALSFTALIGHIMCSDGLLDSHITDEQKREHYRHAWTGVACYGIATLAAPFLLVASIILIVFIPLYYITLRLMHDHESMA